MGYAIGDRRLCHFERFFYSVGTIIEPGQDVTVQIDHSSPPLSPPGTERLPGAQRKQNSGENLPHPPRLHVLCQFSSQDRKSTRLNSSHTVISYAVFCLKKKKPYIIMSKAPSSANDSI